MPKPDYGATISYLYFWYLSKIGVTQKHWTQSLQYHTSVSKVIKQNRVYKITNPLSYQRVSLTLICLVQVETVNLFIVTSFISKFSVVSYILLIFFLWLPSVFLGHADTNLRLVSRNQSTGPVVIVAYKTFCVRILESLYFPRKLKHQE